MARPRDPFQLRTERLGPLPIINDFIQRLGLEELFERFVPTTNARTRLPYAKGLGVLLRSMLVEREPIYRQYESVQTFSPKAFGLTRGQVTALTDDGVGRALDHLFTADRATLLTSIAVAATKGFGLKLDELHNDSTTVKFFGQYKQAKGRSIRGRRAPWIRHGYSKDHRPDLKQLLFILTTTADGAVPLHFRCEDGNTGDTSTHLETWRTLRALCGRTDFLYVADSKLCATETMEAIAKEGGRLVTVLPRSRQEDGQFREWIQEHEPAWETVWDRPNPRRKYGPRDVWKAWKFYAPSIEGWPIIWVYSSLLRQAQEKSRQDRISQGVEELEALKAQIEAPRARIRVQHEIERRIDEIVTRLKIKRYLRAWVYERTEESFKQSRPGRPGKDTLYRKKTRMRYGIAHEIDQAVIDFDKKSDGMYPLLTNDRELTPAAVLGAHKRQPALEKRFQGLKSVQEIAPVFLKNEGRVEALFFLHFVALLVESLIERTIREAMKSEEIVELPLYPEERLCRRPTARRIFQIFSTAEGHVLLEGGEEMQVFQPELTDMHKLLLKLLGVPESAYKLATN